MNVAKAAWRPAIVQVPLSRICVVKRGPRDRSISAEALFQQGTTRADSQMIVRVYPLFPRPLCQAL